MYPNLGAGSNLPSAPPPPSSSSASPSTLSNSGASRPLGFSSLMSQPNNQSTPYPSGSSSQAPYPTGPSAQPPYPTNNLAPNSSKYSAYALPNVGGPPPSSQGGSGSPSNPPPPPLPSQSSYQNPNQSQQGGYPPQGSSRPTYDQQQQPPNPNPYASNPQRPTASGNPSYDQQQQPPNPNPYASNPQRPTASGNPPYDHQQQSYQNPYPANPQRPAAGGYSPYDQPQQPPPPPNPNPYAANPQRPTAGGYSPYDQQQQQQQPQSYQNPYSANPQRPAVGGYPPYNQQQQQLYPNFHPSYPQQGPGGYPFAGGSNANSYGSPAANDRIRTIAGKYEISDTLAQRLSILQQYEIVVLCDDSGSMNTPVDGTNGTRWDELRAIVQIIIEIGTVFDSNGVDVYFLNRPPMPNVTDSRQVVESFTQRPGGLTPLTNALRQIFQSNASRPNSDKSLLVFVATDGAPTDAHGNVDVSSLESLMRNERRAQSTYVTFLACTDDEQSVSYLSQWDRTMMNVDVVDDYKSERDEIRRAKGMNFPFSFGDYVVKALLGAVDPQMDALDEVGGGGGGGGYNNNNNYGGQNFRRF